MPYKTNISICFHVLLLCIANKTVMADEIKCPLESGSNVYTNQTIETSHFLNELLDWCILDVKCSYLFNQNYRKNITVFRHLISPQLYNIEGYFVPLQELLCTGKSLYEINRDLWLLRIKANREQSQPLCDVNHDLVFYENELKTECVCKADRICDDKIYDLVPFYIALALITLLAILFVGAQLYKMRVELKALDAATNKGEAMKALSYCLQ